MQLPTVADGRAWARFFANGVRHIANGEHIVGGRSVNVSSEDHESALRSLEVGDAGSIETEDENPADPWACLITTDGVPMGWVPEASQRAFAGSWSRAQFRRLLCASVTQEVRHTCDSSLTWTSPLRATSSSISKVAGSRFSRRVGWGYPTLRDGRRPEDTRRPVRTVPVGQTLLVGPAGHQRAAGDARRHRWHRRSARSQRGRAPVADAHRPLLDLNSKMPHEEWLEAVVRGSQTRMKETLMLSSCTRPEPRAPPTRTLGTSNRKVRSGTL